MYVSPVGLNPGPRSATASGADRTETARSCNWRDGFHAVPPLGFGKRGFRCGLGWGGTQASKADAVESLEKLAVCGQQGWGGKSPGAVPLPESVSKQAHSKRFASSGASWVAAAAHGLRQPQKLRESSQTSLRSGLEFGCGHRAASRADVTAGPLTAQNRKEIGDV